MIANELCKYSRNRRIIYFNTTIIQKRIPMGLEEFRKSSLNRIDRSVPFVSKLMALMLLMYALLSFFVIFRSGEFNKNILVLISIVVMVAASCLIFMDFKFNLYRTIGLYAISIATNRLAKYIQGLDPPYGVQFVYYIVMIVLAINMFVTASFFLRGSVRGRFGMLFGSTMMMLMTILSFVFLTTGEYRITWDELVLQQPDTIFLILLYATLIFILNTSPIRTNTDQERQMSTLNTIRRTMTCDEKSFICRKDANVLLKGLKDQSEWDKIPEGPAECEYWMKIYHAIGDYSYLVVQKWKEYDNVLFFTLTGNREGAIIDAYRFSADCIEEITDEFKNEYVTLFNREGGYVRILIKEDPPA